MKNHPPTQIIPHIEHTTCPECGIERRFKGERYVDWGYAMVYCPDCKEDFDVQIPSWWIEEK